MKQYVIALVIFVLLGFALVLFGRWNRQQINIAFSHSTFPWHLAEHTAELGGVLPDGPEAFIAWHRKKDPRADWPADAYAHLYDVQWSLSVTNLTDAAREAPPVVIACKPDYLKEHELEINRAFVRMYLDHMINRDGQEAEFVLLPGKPAGSRE